MCSAQPSPPEKPGTVEEDAGTVDDAGVGALTVAEDAVGVAVDIGVRRCMGDVVVLELFRGEHRCVGVDVHRLGVAGGAVAEVGTERTTALVQLGGIDVEDALAAVAEQAGPVRLEELALESPDGARTDDLDVGVVGWSLAGSSLMPA